MVKIKTIGIMTSGGDAPGMNAAVSIMVSTSRVSIAVTMA